jgi:hypothetical protein
MTKIFDGRENEREGLNGLPLDGTSETDTPTRPAHTSDGLPAVPPTDELTPRRRARKPGTRSRAPRRANREPVVALPLRKTLTDEVQELEAQGFTEDEAVRLISVSERVAHSGEAREAEELLRRLHFTRWLVEHGMLDEFSA